MNSPNKNQKISSPNSKVELSPDSRMMSPNSRKLVGFKPKQLSDLKPIKPGEKSVTSPVSRH